MAFYPSPVSIIHVQVLKWCQVAENSGARRRCRSWCHDASQVQPVHFPSAPDTPHRQQRSSSWCTTAWVFKNIHLFTELALPNSCCHYITIMHLNILYICIQSPAFAHTDSRNSAALSWAILSAHSCQTMRRSSLKPSLLNSMLVEVPRPWMSKPCFQVSVMDVSMDGFLLPAFLLQSPCQSISAHVQNQMHLLAQKSPHLSTNHKGKNGIRTSRYQVKVLSRQL